MRTLWTLLISKHICRLACVPAMLELPAPLSRLSRQCRLVLCGSSKQQLERAVLAGAFHLPQAAGQI